MIKVWTLILIISTGGNSNVIPTQYETQNECLMAGKYIHDALDDSSYVHYTCVKTLKSN